jgi:uncharacterized protein
MCGTIDKVGIVMQLDLKELQVDARVEISGRVTCRQLAAEIPQVLAVEDADVNAIATRETPLIRVEGHIQTSITYICSRCLNSFSAPLRTALQEMFSEDEAEDEDVHQVSGRFLELDPYVHEAVHLAIEPRPLCKEDCKGLCPECGVDLNQSSCDCENRRIDPRFAALEGLILDDHSE